MPGQIAPAYVAVDANTPFTGARAGWFGGRGAMHESACIPSPRWRPDWLPRGGIFATLRTSCVDVD